MTAFDVFYALAHSPPKEGRLPKDGNRSTVPQQLTQALTLPPLKKKKKKKTQGFLKELKFGIGDGNLQYYLYNWRLKGYLTPQQIGLVLL